MTPKKKIAKWGIVLIIISVVVRTVGIFFHFFTTVRISGSKMSPTYNDRSVLLVKRFRNNETLHSKDVIVYKVPYEDTPRIGRMFDLSTINDYIPKSNFDENGKIFFVLAGVIYSDDSLEDVELTYTPISYEELILIGNPTVGDSLPEITLDYLAGYTMIVDAPSNKEIIARVVGCIAYCR